MNKAYFFLGWPLKETPNLQSQQQSEIKKTL